MNDSRAERNWRSLYLVGAVVALVFLTGSLFDIALTMVPGWEPATTPASVPAWFAQFATNPLLGMRNLDLLNAVLSLVVLPLYVALFGAHRRAQPALALVALVVVVVGAVLFVGNNAALPMLELSRRYASATGGEQAAIQGAAQALLARGAHGSFGAFLGFFVSEVGTLLMAIAMLHGRVFGRTAGWIGIAGASVLMVYSVAMTVSPGSEALVKGIAAPGGLLMIAWDLMVARGLIGLAKRTMAQPVAEGTPQWA